MSKLSTFGKSWSQFVCPDHVRFARRVLLWLACGVFAASPVADADQPLDDYNLAVQLYRQNRWAFAAESFRKFVKDYPAHEKLPYARLYLGLTLVNQADFKGAREELRGFVKDYPKNQNIAQAQYRVAECSYLLNDLPAAKTELQTFLKEHPQDELGERAWPYLGDVHLRLGDPAAASASFAEAVRRYPAGTLIDDAQFGWAKSLEAEQKFPEALAKYRELAKGDGPRAAEALFQIGNREFDAGNYAEAAVAYRSLAERFPANPLIVDAHLNAGFALFRQSEYAAAAAEFEVAGRDPDREVQAGYWRALCLKSQSQFPAAIEALAALSEKAVKDPLADAILFQRGMCERLADRPAEAQATLLAVVGQSPQGEYADDALHFATELAIEAQNLTAAKERLDRFAKDYPRSGLRMYQELLSGRYQLALANQFTSQSAGSEAVEASYAVAAVHFEKVLQDSNLPRTRAQARYYLALTRQLQGNHPEALKVMQPLVGEVLAGQNAAEFSDVLVLQADSLLQTNQFAEAVTAAQKYVEQFQQGRQRPRALSLLALAQTQNGKIAESGATIQTLQQESPQASITTSTLLRLAELADGRSDWLTAAQLYEQLATLGGESDNGALGLRGLGWAQFQQRQFDASAKTFAVFAAKFPQHRLISEATYLHADSLRETGQLTEAATAFSAVLEKHGPSTPPEAGAEEVSPLSYAYRAGLQAARTHRQAKDVEAADAAYAVLLERFPHPQHVDRLLDEWALLNYDAERYDRADEIFRRLIKEAPDSDLADNARLSLAESDLIANRVDVARQAFEELRTSEKSDAGVRERALYQLLVLALDQRRWGDVLKLGTEYRAAFPESPSLAYVDYAAAEAVIADPQTPNERLEALVVRLGRMTADLPPDSAVWAPRLWVLAAEAQFRLKHYDDIARTVADLKAKLPETPLIYQAEEVWGRALKQQAKFPESREVLERVTAAPAAFRTETAAKSQFLVAETWFLQEKWKEAFLAYQKVYASYAYPDWQSAALLQAAKCDEQLGNLKDAIATYDRLIQEFPTSTHVDEARKRLQQAKLKTGSER